MTDLMPVTYSNQRILTTEQLAEVYETDVNNIQMNFINNKERFAEGKHYYFLEGSDLKAFKRQPNSIGSPIINKFTSKLYLWTEKGANRHSKILDTDRAWQQFDILEETYFRVKNNEQLPIIKQTPEINTNIEILNEMAKILFPIFEKAGMSPQNIALTAKQIYRKGGLELPVEGLKSEKEIYDLTSMANILGVYSISDKPHGKAVSAIIQKLDIPDTEKEIVHFEKNGHMGTTIQYTNHVVKMIEDWLLENGKPEEIESINSSNKKQVFRVMYH